MRCGLWFESTKPKVFAASVAPVLLGTALAYGDGVVAWSLAPLILVCAMLIQLISNWVNDLYDFRRGADTVRVGPRRLLVEGLLSYRSLRAASWTAAVVCLLLGVPLIIHAGWPVLIIGLVCLVAAWAYTGGPYPLAYHGLGDLAAFLLFGVTGVTGTYFIHTSTVTADAWVLTLGPGLLVANILGVNNIRDIVTDASVGKRTLATRLGDAASRQLYTLTTIVAIVLPSLLLLHRGPWMLLPLATAPLAIWECYVVRTRVGLELNQALAGTSALYLLYAVLMAIGLVLSSW